jgi:predicted DNA-binding ribbon-helix-helix protein
MFWEALERAATASGRPLNALIARVDAERLEAPNPPNLASALRQWLFRQSGESH